MKAKNNKVSNGNPELIEALEAIEKEKDISKEILIDAIQNSLLAACKDHRKHRGGTEEFRQDLRPEGETGCGTEDP